MRNTVIVENKGAEREGEATGTRVKHLTDQQPLAKKQERGEYSRPGEPEEELFWGSHHPHHPRAHQVEGRLRSWGTMPMRPPEAR